MTAPLPITWPEDGLIPAVIQDATSDDVLMVGFMNSTALDQTRSTGFVHFWSRSRGKLWKKGETSGHVQQLRA
jgi:phosphoribosyl-AMP cyclohydrolase